jgi:hypothetical protein
LVEDLDVDQIAAEVALGEREKFILDLTEALDFLGALEKAISKVEPRLDDLAALRKAMETEHTPEVAKVSLH